MQSVFVSNLHFFAHVCIGCTWRCEIPKTESTFITFHFIISFTVFNDLITSDLYIHVINDKEDKFIPFCCLLDTTIREETERIANMKWKFY